MSLQALETASTNAGSQQNPTQAEALDYPMREYIGGMTRDLAQMARRDGDEILAVQLERASDRAALPAPVQAFAPTIQTGA